MGRNNDRWTYALYVYKSWSVSSQRYRDETIELYVRLFKGACGSLFVDDNASHHRENHVDEFFNDEDSEQILWSAKSFAINSIGLLWNRNCTETSSS